MFEKLGVKYLTKNDIIRIYEKRFGYTYHMRNYSAKEIDEKLISAAEEIQKLFFELNK